jgi:hypothetical protein
VEGGEDRLWQIPAMWPNLQFLGFAGRLWHAAADAVGRANHVLERAPPPTMAASAGVPICVASRKGQSQPALGLMSKPRDRLCEAIALMDLIARMVGYGKGIYRLRDQRRSADLFTKETSAMRIDSVFLIATLIYFSFSCGFAGQM